MLDQIESLRASGQLPEEEEKSKDSTKDAYGLTIPNGRMKKIVKLDPELKSISKEAIVLLTKSCELFTSKLGTDSYRVAQIQNRRTVLLEDVLEICSSREQFLFLKDDMKDVKAELSSNKKKSYEKNDIVSDCDDFKKKSGAILQYFSAVSK